MELLRRQQEATSDRLDTTQKRLFDAEIRLATELVGVSKAVGEVRDLLRDRLDQRDRVDDHEQRIRMLETSQRPR